MNARRITLDNGRTLVIFNEHTDECSGEHDPISGACIARDEDQEDGAQERVKAPALRVIK